MALLSPIGNSQVVDSSGDPAVNWTWTTYEANSSTPATTYTTEAGAVAQSNPVTLNALGMPDNPIWLAVGAQYKFILKDSSGTTKATFDYIEGVSTQFGSVLSSVAGTNTITATGFPAPTGYTNGDIYSFIPAATNTAAATLNISGKGAVNIFANGAALNGGEMKIGVPVMVQYDGTQFNIIGPQTTPLTGAVAKNRIINGNFSLDQRVNSATTRADDAYCIDRWYVLTQTSTITVTQQSVQTDGIQHNIRLTQAQASAQRMGVAQIVLGNDSISDRAHAMTLSAKIRCSSAQAIRYAILEWTGTAGSVTSDVVLDWTSGAYTAGNFFLAANLTVTAVGSITPSANTWTSITALTGTAGSALNNWVIFFWTEGTAAQNVTLDIGKVQFERGGVATEFEIVEWVDNYLRCLHFYEQSFPYGTAPAQNAGVTGCARFPQVVAASTAMFTGSMFYKVVKRTVPSVTLYNPSAANAEVRNISTSADCASTAVGANLGENSFHVTTTTPGGTAAGQTLGFHWSSDAEM